ncbi:MAG: hypothetical protein JWN67_3928 [Actinomycetia bacterium]|nr:hypothetical protein [Actinomycetes bacterium]
MISARVGRSERGLAAVGLSGLVIALACRVAVVARGPFIEPEGKLLDAATFTFGVAVFTLTVVLLLPLAGYSDVARRRWRRSYYVFAIYGLAAEPIQAFRGLDPRFTEAGGPIDVAAGIVFGATAVVMTVVSVVLGLRFFRADVLPERPVLRLGIRYGFTAVMLSFAIGIIMSIVSGRVIGEAGDLLPAHALGVHGIQALPAVALLGSPGTDRRASVGVHVAGAGWLAACVAMLAQALLGRPPLESSLLPMVAVAGAALWVAAGLHASRSAWGEVVRPAGRGTTRR